MAKDYGRLPSELLALSPFDLALNFAIREEGVKFEIAQRKAARK